MLVPGIVLCSARLESSNPAPHKPLIPQAVPNANRRVVPVMMSWMRPGVRFGLRAIISDAVAAT